MPDSPPSPGKTLTPGHRVDLKRRIAQTLAQQEWADIDLTLDEFALPTRYEWSGDKSDYVLTMLRTESSDEALAQLDAYLHPTNAPPAPRQPERYDDPENPWSGKGLRLFLSHAVDNAELAGALRQELGRRSVDAFVAHESIEPTEDWHRVIVSALRTCDACLALLSPGFRESAWTDQEVGFCMARRRLVVPVEHGVAPYGFLGKYQSLRVRPGQTHVDIALAVFELLVRNERSCERMARALVTRWAETASFNAARENYSFLKLIPSGVWTPRLVNEVWEARERNTDLREASINWQPSDTALEALLGGAGAPRPARSRRRVKSNEMAAARRKLRVATS